MEVIERKLVFEERYIDEFYSCTEIMGFWNSYKIAKPDVRDTKLYFTLRVFPKIGKFPALNDWQYVIMMNDLKRNKHDDATNTDLHKCVAASMQMAYGDCPEKSGPMNALVMNHIPSARKSEGEQYWIDSVMKAYGKLAGKSREDLLSLFFKTGEDWHAYNGTQFTGRWTRCSDEDNHNDQLPEDDHVVFVIKQDSLEIHNPATNQVCIDMDLNEVSNWGCSKDQFVYSTGESHSRVKEYFKCPTANQICWLLNIYAHEYVEQTPDYTSTLLLNHVHLDKKKRHISVFSKVSDE